MGDDTNWRNWKARYIRPDEVTRFVVAASVNPYNDEVVDVVVLYVEGQLALENAQAVGLNADDFVHENPPGAGLWLWTGHGLREPVDEDAEWIPCDGEWSRPDTETLAACVTWAAENNLTARDR